MPICGDHRIVALEDDPNTGQRHRGFEKRQHDDVQPRHLQRNGLGEVSRRTASSATANRPNLEPCTRSWARLAGSRTPDRSAPGLDDRLPECREARQQQYQDFHLQARSRWRRIRRCVEVRERGRNSAEIGDRPRHDWIGGHWRGLQARDDLFDARRHRGQFGLHVGYACG